ncbi:MAG: hypothetical protein H7A22_00165 [Spirochaetales bacterium]|nr:hypothetical protein [Spirochaetales bacterium]
MQMIHGRGALRLISMALLVLSSMTLPGCTDCAHEREQREDCQNLVYLAYFSCLQTMGPTGGSTGTPCYSYLFVGLGSCAYGFNNSCYSSSSSDD